MISKKAFTLAEVLFALTVVGIVAALTIPALLQDIGHADAVSRLLKSYSTIYAAQNMLKAEGNDMDTVFAGDRQHANVANAFATKLNVIKNCGTGTGCFPNVAYKGLDGVAVGLNYDSFNGYGKLILNDGTSLGIYDDGTICNNSYTRCGDFIVDVNGIKGPNIMGRDLFQFEIYRDIIYPYGSLANPTDCTTTGYGADNGYNCAAKVIRERAMNY